MLAAGARTLNVASDAHTNPPAENPVMSEPYVSNMVCADAASVNMPLVIHAVSKSLLSIYLTTRPPSLSEGGMLPGPLLPEKAVMEELQKIRV